MDRLKEKQEQRIRKWETENFARRLWAKDSSLWSKEPAPEITDRMGWLHMPDEMPKHARALSDFAEAASAEGLRHVVLLGMGGSSLAPEVFQQTFGNAPGYPELIVLDSTHPEAVRAVASRIDLSRTLFLVSSKSGTTTEMLSFFYYFWSQMRRIMPAPGRHFAAITDPGTSLERLARERGFRTIFSAPSDVGGRYSALTVFGLVPAALIGVDVPRILERAAIMAKACTTARDNPGLDLGAALGEAAIAGRDKVTLITSPALAAFPAWIEQLIAESTGKDDKGIVPVADEPPGAIGVYGDDRLFFYIGLKGDDEANNQLSVLEGAGHPVIRFYLDEKADLGAEFFRWEIAVAAAGAVLGIHPFNQPDVQLAKELARRAMEQKDGPVDKGAVGVTTVEAVKTEDLSRALAAWEQEARPGDYAALQAYLAPTAEVTSTLQEIRRTLQGRRRLATTLGYGPRFLHSTGQLHKGGPNTGLFLQLVDTPAEDLAVPETNYTFGELIVAQALGDLQALQQRRRRVLRVHLGNRVMEGLERIAEALRKL